MTEQSHKLYAAELFLLVAASLSGGTLLALEVVWFRFLLLFDLGTSVTFSAMLSVVLCGIGLGGILASWWLKRRSNAPEFVPLIAFAAGTATAVTYSTASAFLPNGGSILPSAAHLMFPTSLLSGILFTFIGSFLGQRSRGATETAGLVTLANTVGAMAGALTGGFFLLPALGIELSVMVLSVGYGVVALLITIACWPSGPSARRLQTFALGCICFVAFLALFPRGLMRNHYLPMVASPWLNEMSRIVAVREGLTETLVYVRQDLGGEPYFYRLLTNGFSMSGTPTSSRRYMGMFVYLPIALRPNAKRALLISYGVGNTAKALTDTASLETIDVVDTSRDILEISQEVLPVGADPLKDARVRSYIEDGRFFLLTTSNTYDVITGEPPPPKHAGIVNLYSREYFQLIHDRLTEAGVASYWLPVHLLSRRDAMAIIGAFCDAFTDCTLWSGYGAEWMLVGTKGLQERVTEQAFARQWSDPTVSAVLKTVGLEAPEALGAAFIADSVQLRQWCRDVPPLTDNYPQRLSPRPASDSAFFQSLLASAEVRQRFSESAFIQKTWPVSLRERTLDWFTRLESINRYAWTPFGGAPPGLADLHKALVSSNWRTPVLWMMGSGEEVQQIASRLYSRGIVDSSVHEIFGIGAMANRDYVEAERHFRQAQPFSRRPETVAQWRVLAVSLAGDIEQAGAMMSGATQWLKSGDAAGWAWLSETFSLPKIIDPAAPATIP